MHEPCISSCGHLLPHANPSIRNPRRRHLQLQSSTTSTGCYHFNHRCLVLLLLHRRRRGRAVEAAPTGTTIASGSTGEEEKPATTIFISILFPSGINCCEPLSHHHCHSVAAIVCSPEEKKRQRAAAVFRSPPVTPIRRRSLEPAL